MLNCGKLIIFNPFTVGGTVTSWLVRSSLDRVVRVRVLAGHCVVFLGKTPYSHGASLHPGV